MTTEEKLCFVLFFLSSTLGKLLIDSLNESIMQTSLYLKMTSI